MELERIDSVARRAYLPYVENTPGGPADSRFGGCPLVRPADAWPRCGACNREMSFLLQLNLSQLPERPAGLPAAGLYQLFDCRECGLSWDGFSRASHGRYIPEAELSTGALATQGPE